MNCPSCKGTGLNQIKGPDETDVNLVPCHQCLGMGDANPPLLLTYQEAMALPEYSSTYPTGTRLGKRWRRHDGVHDRAFVLKGGKPKWLICEYYEGPLTAKGQVSIRLYRPVIRVKAKSVPLHG